MRPLILIALLATPAVADEHADGAQLYQQHCVACHGATATGDGPMAALLRVPVADLTGIAARNGGIFPLTDVVRIIDGRQERQGHGAGAPMPVFGPSPGGGSAVIDGPDGSVIETTGSILALARYLESLQVAAE